MQPPIVLTTSPDYTLESASPTVAGLASLVSSTSLSRHAASMGDAPGAWPRSRPGSRAGSHTSSPNSSPDRPMATATWPPPARTTSPALVAPRPHRLASGARQLPIPTFRAISPPPSPKSQASDSGWVRLTERPLLLVDDPAKVPEVTARSRSVMDRIQALAAMTDSTVFDVLRRLSDAERASAVFAEPISEARLREMLIEENIAGLSISAALGLQLPETTWRQAYDEVLQDGETQVGLASRLYWRAFAKAERLRDFRRTPTRRESLRRSVSSSAAN